jgi:hypothetical protein
MRHMKLLFSRLNRRDLVLISIIVLGLLAIVFGLLLFFIPPLSDYGVLIMASGQTLAEWTGLILLVLNGTIMKTKYWNYMVAGGLLLVLSAFFMILHLPGAYGLMFVGLVFIEVIYTIRFIQRRYTSPVDWMKYIWTGAWYSATIFIVFRDWSADWWYVSDILFWVTISMFVIQILKYPPRKYT